MEEYKSLKKLVVITKCVSDLGYFLSNIKLMEILK